MKRAAANACQAGLASALLNGRPLRDAVIPSPVGAGDWSLHAATTAMAPSSAVILADRARMIPHGVRGTTRTASPRGLGEGKARGGRAIIAPTSAHRKEPHGIEMSM